METKLDSCPHCGSPRTNAKVMETRMSYACCAVRRRYVCGKCDGRFTTYEFHESEIRPYLDQRGVEE